MSASFDNLFTATLGSFFGLGTWQEPPDTVPLRILGLRKKPTTRDAVKSAFRARIAQVHPDVTSAPYAAVPWLHEAAETQAAQRPEVAELIWARDILLRKMPESVTANNGGRSDLFSRNAGPYLCPDCKRPITGTGELPASHHRGWGNHCAPCGHEGMLRQQRERRRQARADRPCEGCGAAFTPARSDGRYCSPGCRQKAYRRRAASATVPYPA